MEVMSAEDAGGVAIEGAPVSAHVGSEKPGGGRRVCCCAERAAAPCVEVRPAGRPSREAAVATPGKGEPSRGLVPTPTRCRGRKLAKRGPVGGAPVGCVVASAACGPGRELTLTPARWGAREAAAATLTEVAAAMGARPVVAWGPSPRQWGRRPQGSHPRRRRSLQGLRETPWRGGRAGPGGQGEGRRAGSRGGRRRARERPAAGRRGPSAEVGGKEGKEAGGWGWKDLALVPCRMGKTLTLH